MEQKRFPRVKQLIKYGLPKERKKKKKRMWTDLSFLDVSSSVFDVAHELIFHVAGESASVDVFGGIAGFRIASGLVGVRLVYLTKERYPASYITN